MSEGLAEPFEVVALPAREPTDRQLNYAKDLGIMLPIDACLEDVSALISRVVDDDEAPVSEELAKAAYNFGWHMSRYVGTKGILAVAAHKLSAREYSDFLKNNIGKNSYKEHEDFHLNSEPSEAFEAICCELSKPYHSIKAFFKLIISSCAFIIGVLFSFDSNFLLSIVIGAPMIVLGIAGIIKTTKQVEMRYQKGNCPYCKTELIVKYKSASFLCPVCHNTGEQNETSLVSTHKTNIKT